MDNNIEDLVFHVLREEPDRDGINIVIKTLQEKDWDLLIRFLKANGLFPAFYDRLINLKVENIPPKILSDLNSLYLLQLKRHILFQEKLFEIIIHLRKYDIPAIPLKGPVFALIIYNNIALKQAPSDLDILVPYEKVREAGKRLEELGYTFNFNCTMNFVEKILNKAGYSLKFKEDMIYLLYKYRCQLTFNKNIKGDFWIPLDLHWDFRDKLIGMDIIQFWENAEEIEFENVNILVPSREDLLIYLILNSITKVDFVLIKYIYDIHSLITRYRKELDWEKVLSNIKRNKLEAVCSFSLNIAKDLFKTDIPEKVLKGIKFSPIKELFLRRWINKNNILKYRQKLCISPLWRFFVVNFLYSVNLFDYIRPIYKKIYEQIAETIGIIYLQ